ncbi:MAG TPA: hypothetical protein VGL40_04555 [Bacillota bacterium]
MEGGLDARILATMGVRLVVLSVGGYSLPVRFRIREQAVECRVPTRSGVGDRLEEAGEATLVAVAEVGPDLRWLFMRGPAVVVPEPDWEGLRPPPSNQVGPDDLYQLVRIELKRIELVDERRGWGFRETVDR